MWYAIGIALILVGILGYSLYEISARSDEQEERYRQKQAKKGGKDDV